MADIENTELTFTEVVHAAAVLNNAFRMFRGGVLDILIGTPEHPDHIDILTDANLFNSSEALLTAEGEVIGAVATVNKAISANHGLTFTFGDEAFAMRFTVDQ